MSEMNELPTYTVQICMAGDTSHAKEICRAYCYAIGLCVTVEPTTYIYTGGEEQGFRIGLINYPRFPSEPEQIWKRARDLADQLTIALAQHSYLLIAPDKTLWYSRRGPA